MTTINDSASIPDDAIVPIYDPHSRVYSCSRCSFPRHQCCQLARQFGRVPQIVRIEKRYKLASSQFDSMISSPRNPTIAYTDNPDTIILRRHPLCNFKGRVRGAIVYQNDFKMSICLTNGRTQRSLKVILCIEGRNDDADGWTAAQNQTCPVSRT